MNQPLKVTTVYRGREIEAGRLTSDFGYVLRDIAGQLKTGKGLGSIRFAVVTKETHSRAYKLEPIK